MIIKDNSEIRDISLLAAAEGQEVTITFYNTGHVSVKTEGVEVKDDTGAWVTDPDLIHNINVTWELPTLRIAKVLKELKELVSEANLSEEDLKILRRSI